MIAQHQDQTVQGTEEDQVLGHNEDDANVESRFIAAYRRIGKIEDIIPLQVRLDEDQDNEELPVLSEVGIKQDMSIGSCLQ